MIQKDKKQPETEEAIANQAVELQRVAEISTAVASRTTPEEILQTAVDLTRDSFNFYHVHIYLLNEAGDELSVMAGSGKVGRQITGEGRCIALDQEQSLVARAARTRQGVIVNEVEADPGFLPHPLLPYTRSEMAIPMIVGQQLLGILDVQAEEPYRFIDTDIQIITTLAAQVATTLQNARRYEQIQESEAKYRDILENMENGYYETTLEGNFQFFNEALCRVFGYPAKELLGMNYKRMMAEEDGERVYKTFNNVYKTGEAVQSFEYQHIRQDGGRRVINLSISRIEDATGKPVGFRGLGRDITEQKQAEQATQEFLERMKALSEATVELSQVETLDELYKQAIELAIMRLGFDRIGFYTRNDSNNPYLLAATFGTDVHGQIRNEHSFTLNLSEIPQYMEMIARKERLLVSEDADLWDNEQIVGRGWHITAPVWDDEEFLGIFFVDNLHRQQPLKPYEPELLTLYSTTVASLVVQKRTEEAIAKQAIELEAVMQVSAAVSQTLDPTELLQNVVDLTKARFKLYHAHIYLLGTRRQTLHLAAGAGEIGRLMVEEGRHVPLYQEQSLIAQAAREHRGIISNDLQADTNFLPYPLLPETRAEMAVPIMLADEVVGVLDVQSERVGAFTEDDIRIQTTLATQVAVALQNSRLFAESEKARAELGLLTRRLTHEGWQDYKARQVSDMVFDYGIGEIVPTEQTDTAVTKMEQTLVVQGESIGYLALDEPGALTDDAAVIMAAVAERLSIHIENLRLTEQTQTALAETEALYRASAELSRTQTYEELLATMRHHTLLGGHTPYVSLNYFDRPWTELQQPEQVNVLARYSQLSTADMPTQYEVAHFILTDAVLRRDTPTIIEDVANDSRLDGPLRLLLQQRFGAVSTLFVPLVVSGQWVGFIHAVYHKPAQFSDAEMRRLMALAGQAAVVAQTIRLLEETQTLLESEQRQRRIADKLVNATARMTGILDEQEICYILIDEINDFIQPYQISLYAWSEDNHCLRLDQRILASPDDAEDDYQLNQLITQEERPDLWVVFQKNKPLLEAAKQTDEFFREHYCLPWLVGGQVAGLIEAYHTARFLAIRDVDQRAAEDMVRQADLRIQNARLFAQSRRRAEELAILNEMGRNLTVTQDVNEVVETIYAYANRLMDAQNFYVALYHPEDNNITFPLAREAGREIELVSRQFGEGATEYVIQSGQPLLIEDGVAKWLEDHGFNPSGAVARSWLGIPLAIGKQVIGAIAVRSSAPSAYDINHQNLLIAISGQSAIAIQNARLFAQTQEQLADLTTIQQTTSGLTAANSLEGAVNVLLSQVVAAVQADSAHLFLIEGENGVRIGMYPLEPDEAVHLTVPVARHPVIRKAVETRQPIVVSVNDSRLQEHTRQVILDWGLTTIAVIPLVGGEGVMGILLVGTHRAERVFDLNEVGLLQTLADQATIAFERVRLLEDAQRRARREQLLREITGRVRSSADIDTIMKTAVQEIGRALGRETFISLASE